jgi:hypothetical protein
MISGFVMAQLHYLTILLSIGLRPRCQWRPRWLHGLIQRCTAAAVSAGVVLKQMLAAGAWP